MDLRQNLEEEQKKDFQLLKQLEDKRRYEEDPRQILKWDTAIKDVNQRIYNREAQMKSLVIDIVSVSNKLPPQGHQLGSVPPTKAIEVFFSFARKDEKLRDDLEKHLSILKRQGVITAWHNRKIGAGKEWQNEIDTHLDTASVILLLISANFIASDYCWDVEVRRAMERHQANEARVIPVILRPTNDWESAPFGNLKPLPKDGKPVNKWGNRDEAFCNIAQGIRAAVEELAASV